MPQRAEDRGERAHRAAGGGSTRPAGGCTAPRCGVTRRCAMLPRDCGAPGAGSTLDGFCEANWPAVRALMLRRGAPPADADDLTQSYFARLIEKRWLDRAHGWEGCFRPFLVVSVRNFLANHRDFERAQKRGGGRPLLPLDAIEATGAGLAVDRVTPETLLERQGVQRVLARSLARLARETSGGRAAARLRRLRPFLAGAPEGDSYRRVAAEWEVSEAAVRVAVHRLRRRLGQLVRLEMSALGPSSPA
jgi:RNA polymerase sigma factor (sigma-70 family)